MAIDPDTLAKQRRPRLVGENECHACGKPTAAKGGLCSSCNNGRTPALWSTRRLLDVRRQIDAELRRRRAELDAALQAEPPEER